MAEFFFDAEAYAMQPERVEAKELILDIVAASGGHFYGKGRLYKAFYYTHVHYYRRTGQHLTAPPPVHMTNGPGIDGGHGLLMELHSAGALHVVAPPGRAEVYRLRAPRAVPTDSDRRAAIAEALAFIAGKTGPELSKITHDTSRAWNIAKPGETLIIPFDALTDEQFEERKQLLKESREVFSGLFSPAN